MSKPYSPCVVTRYYRAPELLLEIDVYGTSLDMWSVGCVFAELYLKNPLFVASTEKGMLNEIFK
jgi:serine/threonine protein kinase